MKRYIMAAVIGLLVAAQMVLAAAWFMESKYGTYNVTPTDVAGTTFTAGVYTNTGDRVGIGSIFVRANTATGNWSILLIANNQTNQLVAPTALTPSGTYTIKYDGSATVPLGKDGVIMVTGTVYSNAATLGVQWSVHTLGQ